MLLQNSCMVSTALCRYNVAYGVASTAEDLISNGSGEMCEDLTALVRHIEGLLIGSRASEPGNGLTGLGGQGTSLANLTLTPAKCRLLELVTNFARHSANTVS